MYHLLKCQGHFLGLATAEVPRRARFDPRSVRVRFVVSKVALGQVFLRVLSFSLVSVIPPLLQTHLHRNTVAISVCPSNAAVTI